MENIRFPNALALSSSLVVVNPVHGKYDKYRKDESTTDKKGNFLWDWGNPRWVPIGTYQPGDRYTNENTRQRENTKK